MGRELLHSREEALRVRFSFPLIKRLIIEKRLNQLDESDSGFPNGKHERPPMLAHMRMSS